MNDAVAVSGELGAGGRGRLWEATATRLRRVTRVWLQGHAYFELSRNLATSGDNFAHQRIRRSLHHALTGLVDQDEFDLSCFGFFIYAHEF